MPKQTYSMELESAPKELASAIAKLVGAYKKALSDGFQPGQDLPAMVSEALMDFPAIVAQLPLLAADQAEDKMLFYKSFNVGAWDIVEAAVK